MIRKILLSFVMVLGLVLVSACGGGQTASEPTAAPPQEKTQPAGTPAGKTAAPSEVATATVAATVVDSKGSPTKESATEAQVLETPVVVEANKGLSELDSYRINLKFSMEGKNADGKDQSGTVDMRIEVNNVNKQQHVKFSATGPAFEDAENGMTSFDADMFTMDGTSYILADMPDTGNTGPKCISFPGGDQEMPMDPNELVKGLEGTELVKKGETVNGVVTDRYSIDEKSKAFGDVKTVESAKGNIWIAQEGGYLVKLDAEVVGKDAADLEGTFMITYDLQDVNKIETIELPEACANAIDSSQMMTNTEMMMDTEGTSQPTMEGTPKP
jgi:hypothetical protein